MKAKKSIPSNRCLNFITKLQSLYLLCILPKLFDFKICSSSICYDTLTSKPSANSQKCSLHSPRPCAGICGGHALTCTPEQSSGWSRTSNSRYTAKSVAICCVLLPFLPKVVCLQSPLLYLLSSFFLLPHCVSSSGRRYVAPRRLRWRGEAVIATITDARTKLFDIQYVPHQYILINRH